MSQQLHNILNKEPRFEDSIERVKTAFKGTRCLSNKRKSVKFKKIIQIDELISC